MNRAFGMLIVVLFVLGGAYVSFYEMFVGGMVQVHNFFFNEELVKEQILTTGFAKIALSGPFFVVCAMFGAIFQKFVTGKKVSELFNV